MIWFFPYDYARFAGMLNLIFFLLMFIMVIVSLISIYLQGILLILILILKRIVSPPDLLSKKADKEGTWKTKNVNIILKAINFYLGVSRYHFRGTYAIIHVKPHFWNVNVTVMYCIENTKNAVDIYNIEEILLSLLYTRWKLHFIEI